MITRKFDAIFFQLRYAENHSVHGLVLVSSCVTDLGDPNEKASGKRAEAAEKYTKTMCSLDYIYLYKYFCLLYISIIISILKSQLGLNINFPVR